jgi:hypothetical protein
VVLAAVAAGVTAYAGAVLARTYRPARPGTPVYLLSPHAARSVVWVDRHRVASLLLLVLVVVAALLVTWVVVAGRARWGTTTMVAVVMAAVAALATVVTRELVLFDQLALRQVTVGTDVAGYWTAAFDDEVLFALVDGAQVSQQAYATARLVHLAAPVVAAAALLVVAVGLVRAGDPPTPEPDWSL